MNFTHPHFLYLLPLFWVIHHHLVGWPKKAFLLLSSYAFYAYFSPAYCFLLIVSTLVDYGLGLAMKEGRISSRKGALLTAVVNLGILVGFKYLAFLWNDFLLPIAAVLGWGGEPMPSSLPPVGISFFTFQTMSYTLDVARGRMAPTRSLLDLALYVSCFPQLVAGPIVRAKELLPQITAGSKASPREVLDGVQRFARGMVKKLCIADPLAVLLVDPVFADPSSHGEMALFMAMVAYGLQIYYDFSAYSDMAIGLGKTMGLSFPENFLHPYRSTSFSEFWTRWHVSLSSWLRDYLYIPLGGNRQGPLRTGVHLMVTMLLGGLWHGASSNFLIWGGLHGIFLCGQRVLGSVLSVPRWMGWTLVNLGVFAAWVPFRATEWTHVPMFWSSPFGLLEESTVHWVRSNGWELLLLALATLFHFWAPLGQLLRWRLWPLELRVVLGASVLFWVLQFYPSAGGARPFIYFQF